MGIKSRDRFYAPFSFENGRKKAERSEPDRHAGTDLEKWEKIHYFVIRQFLKKEKANNFFNLILSITMLKHALSVVTALVIASGVSFAVPGNRGGVF